MSKVLFILNIPPPYGGGEFVNQGLYDKLKDRYGFLLRRKNSLYAKSSQGRLQVRNVINGIKLIVKSLITISRERPNVVFIAIAKDFPSFFRDSVIIIYSLLFKAKVIGDLHGMTFYFLRSSWEKRYALAVLNRIAAIRILSHSIEMHLREAGFTTVLKVIDNGIPVPIEYLLASPQRRKTSLPCKLLYLGAISNAKGFTEVLKILDSFKESGIDFELNVVGQWIDKNYEAHCRSTIRKEHLTDKIKFHGLLIGDEKWRAISECDIMLMLSKNEGQPIAIIEAFALGIPVIATNVGAIPEMIENGKDGYVVNNCLTEVPAIISQLVASPEEYSSMSENARKLFLNRFSIDKYVHNIESLISASNHE
jgi:glycosyltransferase involved in cell wall biosynthesis